MRDMNSIVELYSNLIQRNKFGVAFTVEYSLIKC